MGVQLFKTGTGEAQTFNEFSYLHLLEQGWHYTKAECYENETDTEKKENDKDHDEEARKEKDGEKVKDEGLLTDKSVRAEAKAAGIKDWKKKPIDLLMEELTNGGDQG